MNVFIRISLVLFLLFVAWAVYYLAFPGAGNVDGNDTVASEKNAGEQQTPVAHQSNQQQPQAGQVTSTVEVEDEKNGQEKASGLKIDPEVAETLKELGKRNSEGLQAEPMQGGGSKVNLKGRYQSVIGAVIDEKGEVHQFEGVPNEYIEDDKENKPND